MFLFLVHLPYRSEAATWIYFPEYQKSIETIKRYHTEDRGKFNASKTAVGQLNDRIIMRAGKDSIDYR